MQPMYTKLPETCRWIPVASSYSGGGDGKADFFQHGESNC